MNPLQDSESEKERLGDPKDNPSQSEDHLGHGDVERPQPAPEGPLYSVFPRSTKICITTMATISCFVSPMTANIYFPILNPLAADLDVSIGLINLTITSYMVFQGLSPTLFGDFGDMAGRRPAFIIAFSIYLAANIGLAFQRNYVALLLLRCLQSFGSSGTIALGFATVADIASSGERGRYMGIVAGGISVGPSLGPFLGGTLAQYLGWPSIFWFCTILTALWLVPFTLVIPETCRSVVGNGSYPPQHWNRTLVRYLEPATNPDQDPPASRRKLRFPNPLRTLAVILDKEMAIILFYNSTLYVAFVDLSATLGTQMKAVYGLNEFHIGLCFLPYGVGCIVAAVLQGVILDWNYHRLARKIGFTVDRKRGDDLTKFPIETARVQPIYPMLAVGLSAMTAYGWALHAKAHLAIPLVLLFLVGSCVPGSFTIMNTLIVDLYPDAPATATAANNLVRCSMGAAGTAVVEYMIQGMGSGWCFTFLAALCAILTPCLLILEKYGPGWREEKAKKAKAAQA